MWVSLKKRPPSVQRDPELDTVAQQIDDLMARTLGARLRAQEELEPTDSVRQDEAGGR